MILLKVGQWHYSSNSLNQPSKMPALAMELETQDFNVQLWKGAESG